jgi:heme A synthase
MQTMKLSYDRIGAGVLLLLILLSVGNHYLEWRIVGEHSKLAIVGVFVALFIYLAFIAPILENAQIRQKSEVREQHVARFRPWLYLLTLAIIMVGFALAGPGLQLARGAPIQREDWTRLIVLEALVVLAGIIGWYRLKRSQS